MTEIVDERQRLVDRLRQAQLGYGHSGAIFGDALAQIEADGKRLAALASRPQEQPRTATATNDAGKIATALSLFASVIKSGEDWTYSCQTALREAFDALERLSVSPAAAQGWQMVPMEPTEAMIRAPHEAYPGLHWSERVGIYQKMLAAAPPAPAAQEQET